MSSNLSVSQLGRLRKASSNGFDRLFRAQTMVRAGAQPFEVIHQQGVYSVRHYAALSEAQIQLGDATLAVKPQRQKVPLVLIAPLAVNMYVYDLLPERSFVRFLLASGFDVYLIDWGKPSRREAGLTLEDYIARFVPDCLSAIRAHSGKQDLSLHGWSMGGGMALGYKALTADPHIRHIVTYGTPIDGHANGAIGKQYARLGRVLKRAGLNFRKVPAKLLYTPGWANVIGFKLLDPIGSLKGYWNLLTQLEDRDYVAQHANQAAFIDSLEAYPGGAIRDWFCSIWLENETAKGRFHVGKQAVQFQTVDCPVLAVAGKSDNLANVPCCKGLMKVLGSTDAEFFVGPGGHIAIVSGKEAPSTIWAKTVDWLAARQ